MSDFDINKAWSDQFIPEIIAILDGCFWPHKFQIGEPEEDRKECCDFKGLHKDKNELIVSSRVRRHEFWPEHANDLTLNLTISSTTRINEVFKIIARGYAEYYFVGFAHESEIKLIDWKIYCLDTFRKWVNHQSWIAYKLPGKRLTNHNNNKEFIAYDMTNIVSAKKFECLTTKEN